MKYIDYINMLNEALERKLINAHEYTLYGSILAMFNAARWTGASMRISTISLCERTGLQKRMVLRSRSHLAELGMLTVEAQTGNASPVYTLPAERCKFAPQSGEKDTQSDAVCGAPCGANLHRSIYIEDKDKDNFISHYVQNKIGERDARAREWLGEFLRSGVVIKNFADREGVSEEDAKRIIEQTFAEMIDGGVTIDGGFGPHLLNKARRKIPRPRGQTNNGTQSAPPPPTDYFATLRAKIFNNQSNAQ